MCAEVTDSLAAQDAKRLMLVPSPAATPFPVPVRTNHYNATHLSTTNALTLSVTRQQGARKSAPTVTTATRVRQTLATPLSAAFTLMTRTTTPAQSTLARPQV